jgi:hypothetical protein
MLVPWEHCLGLALAATPAGVAAALALATDVVQSAFGAPVVRFEHGSVGATKLGGCGVVHAHTHLVPVSSKVARPVLDGVEWNPIADQSWIEAVLDRAVPGDYLYLSIPEVGTWIAWVNGIPSQLLRRWLATEVGSNSWDWRANPVADMTFTAAQTLRDVHSQTDV